MARSNSVLKSCAACIVLLAILIPFSLSNIALFLASTDFIWSVLNYLDGSHAEYEGYIVFNDDAYSPVTDEVIDYNLAVIGTLPPDCNGALFKIGSNPRFWKSVAVKSHWFDGDGMVHAIKLNANNNTAHYSNAYLHSIQYDIESKYNRSLYAGAFGPVHANGIIGFLKFQFQKFISTHSYSPLTLDNQRQHPLGERGTANTAVLHWNHRLFALQESSQPLQFKYDSQTAQLSTVGYYGFNDSWSNMAFTAHPKVDRNTNQLFTYSTYGNRPDEVVVGMTSSDTPDVLVRSKPFKLNSGQIMHDCFITEKYILIFDLNLHFGRDVFLRSNYSKMFGFNDQQKSRIGVIVREQLLAKKKQANIRWFDIEPCFVFHFANAWDENDEITIIGHRFQSFDMNIFQLSKGSMNVTQRDAAISHPQLYRWRLSLRGGGKVEEEALSMAALTEQQIYPLMPVVRAQYIGYKNRFLFTALYRYSDDGWVARYVGIMKFDLDKGEVVNTIMFGEDDNGNTEFAVIPKNNGVDEDDVYLACIIYDYRTRKSRVEIFDGKSMNEQSVATVQLKRKVPMGFHSIFVSQRDLEAMDKL